MRFGIPLAEVHTGMFIQSNVYIDKRPDGTDCKITHSITSTISLGSLPETMLLRSSRGDFRC